MLYFLLFNIAPTLVEVLVVCIIFQIEFGPGLVVATLLMVVVYIAFTRIVTDWRTKLRREMHEIDNQAIARAVDALLNYETGQYFTAAHREAQHSAQAMHTYADIAANKQSPP